METKSIRSQIVGLAIGDSLIFSFDEIKYSSLRSTTYGLSIETGNTYSTKIDRGARTLTVKRTA